MGKAALAEANQCEVAASELRAILLKALAVADAACYRLPALHIQLAIDLIEIEC